MRVEVEKSSTATKVVHSTVSATNQHELNNSLYMQVSNAVTGNSVRASQQTSQMSEESQDLRVHPHKDSLFNLPVHLVQSQNTLRYM